MHQPWEALLETIQEFTVQKSNIQIFIPMKINLYDYQGFRQKRLWPKTSAHHCTYIGKWRRARSTTAPKTFPACQKILKVSKSRKQILKFSFEPKIERKYFCISVLAL